MRLFGMKTPGQRAYEAYCQAFPGPASEIALKGNGDGSWAMPWERLNAGVRAAWEVAAKAGR